MESKLRDWADAASDDEGSAPENQNDHNNNSSDPYAPQQRQREPQREMEQPHRQNHTDIPMAGPYWAFVGNLRFNLDENAIGNYFHNGGCAVKDVVLKLDDQGKSRGFALVEFIDRDSLLLAFKANGESLGSRPIKVDYHSIKSNRGGYERGDGDRNNRDNGGREETGPSWSRGQKREPSATPPQGDISRQNSRGNDRVGDRGGGGGGSPRGGSNRDRSSRDNEPVAAAVRPKLVLAARKVPLEGEEQPAPRVSDIFGGGKPHDESKYEEERKKNAEKERVLAEIAAAKEKELKAISDAEAAALAASEAAVLAEAEKVSGTGTNIEGSDALKESLVSVDVATLGDKLESANIAVVPQAIERGVVVAAATSSDRPHSKQNSRRPSNDGEKGRGSKSHPNREPRSEHRSGYEGGGEGRHEGRGEGRVDGRGEGRGRGRGEGRGRGRGEGREGGSGRGGRHSGRENRDSAGRGATVVSVTPAVPVGPPPVPVVRAQVPLDMNMIGKGSNTGRKAKDPSAPTTATVVKAAPIPVVAQRNAFSDLGGDDSD